MAQTKTYTMYEVQVDGDAVGTYTDQEAAERAMATYGRAWGDEGVQVRTYNSR